MVRADTGRILVISLLLAFMLAGGCALLGIEPAPTPGDPAPPAKVELLGEGSIDFPGHFRDRVIVLCFFSPG